MADPTVHTVPTTDNNGSNAFASEDPSKPATEPKEAPGTRSTQQKPRKPMGTYELGLRVSLCRTLVSALGCMSRFNENAKSYRKSKAVTAAELEVSEEINRATVISIARAWRFLLGNEKVKESEGTRLSRA